MLLTADGEPEGGRWNLDQENRRPPTAGLSAPAPWHPTEDEIDAQVRRDLDAAVAAGELTLWGEDAPRAYAVTEEEAAAALDDFIEHRLVEFGPGRTRWCGVNGAVSLPAERAAQPRGSRPA